MTWEYVTRLKNATVMPVLVKGIVTGEDASLCEAYGADGLVVSNHGARAGASGRSTIECLPEVVEAVGHRIEVICDGGVRRGSDIVKACALGATAVMAGRPHMYALGAAGERGVDHMLELMRSGMENTMALVGAPTVADLDPSLVRLPPR